MQARACLSIIALLALPCAAAAQDAADTATPPVTTPPAQDSASAARDAEGRGLFEAGRAAFTDGRYEDALDYFDRAYALSHRSELLYNIGSANDRLRRDVEALAAFERYVRELPNAPNVREVESRIRVLRQALEDASPAAAEAEATQAEADQAAFEAHAREQAASSAPAPDSGPGVVGEWWFWTILVAVVAGAVVTGVILGTQDHSVHYPPYMTGDNGVAMTLTFPMP